jgi:hypothetical protein
VTLIGVGIIIMDVNITIALPLIAAAIVVLCAAITQSPGAIVAILALNPVGAAVAVLNSVIAGVVSVVSAEAVATVAVAGEEVVFGLYMSEGDWMARLSSCCRKNWLTMRLGAWPRYWDYQNGTESSQYQNVKENLCGVWSNYPSSRARNNAVSLKTNISSKKCVRGAKNSANDIPECARRAPQK